MVRLSLDLGGNDGVFISNSYRYMSGVESLAIFRNSPIAYDHVKEKVDRLQHAYEGGKLGTRSLIEERRRLRKEVVDIFKRIIRFLESVANEDDIPALIQAGFKVIHPGYRRKSVVTPAT